MISSLLDIPSSYNQFEEYYRILGFNNTGRTYLNTLPKNLKNVLKTTLKNETSKTGLIELQATKLYSLLINEDISLQELQIPIKKENKND